MKKTVYLMESFITYVNKGNVELDLDYFPELKDLSNEELATKLASDDYYVNSWLGEIRPKELPEHLKEEYINEDGEFEYDTEDLVPLWEFHSEAPADFDKIKNEEHYFIVEDNS
jgi:hypothetical protein